MQVQLSARRALTGGVRSKVRFSLNLKSLNYEPRDDNYIDYWTRCAFWGVSRRGCFSHLICSLMGHTSSMHIMTHISNFRSAKLNPWRRKGEIPRFGSHDFTDFRGVELQVERSERGCHADALLCALVLVQCLAQDPDECPWGGMVARSNKPAAPELHARMSFLILLPHVATGASNRHHVCRRIAHSTQTHEAHVSYGNQGCHGAWTAGRRCRPPPRARVRAAATYTAVISHSRHARNVYRRGAVLRTLMRRK